MKLFFPFYLRGKSFLNFKIKDKVNVNLTAHSVLDTQFYLWYHYNTNKVYVNSLFKIFLFFLGNL